MLCTFCHETNCLFKKGNTDFTLCITVICVIGIGIVIVIVIGIVIVIVIVSIAVAVAVAVVTSQMVSIFFIIVTN